MSPGKTRLVGNRIVVQFQILTGKQAGTTWVARRFPVQIGRSPKADLCLNEEGVWEQHLVIHLRPDSGFEAVVPEPALASVNGQPFRQAALRNGDVVALGALQVRFGMSPTRQRSLRFRELLTWFALAVLSLGQGVLIYWLGGICWSLESPRRWRARWPPPYRFRLIDERIFSARLG
jgi:hypothetical protein